MNDSFKTIGLIGRPGDSRVQDTLALVADHLRRRKLAILLDSATDAQPGGAGMTRLPAAEMAAAADLVIAVGGDGTMLYAARLVASLGVPLLGINRGRLGFLADVSPADMDERLDEILDGDFVAESRSLLAARLVSANGAVAEGLALNDVVLQRATVGRMLEFETWIDGRFVNTHGGDGMIIASPTGSTAYALSAGGPILAPDMNAIVIAPVCPHTLSDRPVVVSGNSVIETRLIERGETLAQVVCDGTLLGDIETGDRLSVARSPLTITLLHPSDYDYYRILRSKLKWGRGSTGRAEGGPHDR